MRQIQDALASELDVIRQVDMPARRIAWLHDTLTPKTYLDLEPSIRQLEQPAQESVVFLGKVGVGISRARLEEGTYTEYDRVFLLLDRKMSIRGKRKRFRRSAASPCAFGAAIGRRRDTTGV